MAKPNTNIPASARKPEGTPGASDILDDLKTEVSVEAAPLMTFILTHARTIMISLAVFLILVAVGGGWRWYSGKSASESHTALSRVIMSTQGEEKAKALEALAAKNSGASRLAVLLELGNTWLSLGKYDKAAEAYKSLAKIDSEGVLGSMAALNEAGALGKAGKNAEALLVLEAIEPAMPENTRGPVRNMMAEAALAVGNTKQAADIFNTLSAAASGPEAEYYRYRAQSLEATSKASPEAPKDSPAPATNN